MNAEVPVLANLSTQEKYKIVHADYQAIAEQYAKVFDSTKHYNSYLKAFMKYLRPGSRMLLLGGSPQEAKIFSAKFDVTALDISQAMLDQIKSSAPTVKTIVGNTAQLSQPQNLFHAVWAANVINHIPAEDLNRTFQNLAGALELHGKLGLVFTLPDGNNPEFEELVAEPEPTREQVWFYRTLYPLNKIRNQLVKQHFAIERSEKFRLREGNYDETQAYLGLVRMA